MSRATRRLSTVAVIFALVAGCVDSGLLVPVPVNLLPSLIVSSPESPSAGVHAVGSLRGSAQAEAVVGTAWVSLPPGSVSGGQSATLQNGRSGPSITVSMVDGGLDPVAIPASVGDTLFVNVASAGNSTLVSGFQVVAASRAPRVVRTSPPPGKRDVPLNASIVAVFSAPIDPATLSPSAFGLVRGGTVVSGTVQSLGPSGVSAAFYPDSSLAPLTSYQLFVTQAIRDVNGASLAASVTSTFTTDSAAPTTGNLQIIISGLPGTALGALTVSGPGGFRQSVTASTMLSALVPGLYTITALNVWASSSTYGPAQASQTMAITASTTPSAASVTYAVLPNGWTTMAPMPTARSSLAGGVVSGILYAVGGLGASDVAQKALSTVEAYDPATNVWTTRASMPTARWGLAVGVVNGILYAVGGVGPSGPGILSTVEAYDPATNTWATKAPMPTARGFLALGVVNGILYAAGGEGTNHAMLNTVEAYDPATNTWVIKATMPTARANLAAGVVNGQLYAVGGNDGTNDLSTVVAYDAATNKWTSKGSISAARYDATAGVVDGVLYAVGGGDSAGNFLSILEGYDPATNKWSSKATMPTARGGLAVGISNGVLYAVGGLVPTGAGKSSTLEAYTP